MTDEAKRVVKRIVYATGAGSTVRALKVEARKVYPDLSQFVVHDFGRFADWTHARLHKFAAARCV